MRDVIIAGAGPAGLGAGVRLADHGFSVTVLEKRSSGGGRIRQIHPGISSAPIDWAQHLMLGCYHETSALAARLGTQKSLVPVTDETPFMSGPDRIHPYRVGKLPAPFHTLPGLMGLTQLSRKERLMLARPLAQAKLSLRSSPRNLDRIPAEAWLRKNGQSINAIRGFWNPLVVSTLNVDACEASALLLATVVDRGFISLRDDAVPLLADRTLHDVFIAPAVKTIEKTGGRVLFGQKVNGIVSDGRRVTALTTSSGRTYRARCYILAVPSWNIPEVAGNDEAMYSLLNCTRTMSSSPIINADLWFEKRWMKYPYAGLLDSPVHWIFNHDEEYDPSGSRKLHRISIVISSADDLIKYRNSKLVDIIIAEIRRFFPDAGNAQPAGHLVNRVIKATFRAGVGQYRLRPGPQTSFDNLFLAGDWTATGLPATIESAVLSGKNAAKAILKWHCDCEEIKTAAAVKGAGV